MGTRGRCIWLRVICRQEECNNFDLVIETTLTYIISLRDCRGSALLSKSIAQRVLLSFLEATKSEGDAYE